MEQPNDFYQLSMCQNEYLHRFKIVEEYPQGVLEVCEICGMDKFFRILDGKVDNQEYMAYHLRQVLPRFHELYDHEYSYNPLNNDILSPYGNE